MRSPRVPMSGYQEVLCRPDTPGTKAVESALACGGTATREAVSSRCAAASRRGPSLAGVARHMSPPTTSHSLDRSFLQGIAWTGGIAWLTQLFSWGATLVVARLLTPTDYGLVSMAFVYVGLAQIIGEAGLNAAAITQRDLNENQIAQLGGVSLMGGGALCALTLAPPQ